MNIRKRLRFLEAIQQPRKSEPASLPSTDAIESVLNGKFVANPAGATLLVSRDYSLNHEHGLFPLRRIDSISPQFLRLAGSDEKLMNLDLRRAVFFDTETTGLAGGSGTYIFLAGLGHFEDDVFRVKQFFLRDFPDEPAMLQEIMAMMEKFDFIISFNGKSYDWPLLITRFTYHRMKIRNAEPGHFDLLHAARRIWKNSLPDCSLGSLERHVLSVQRQGDIPSSFIPQMYFDYLRTKNAIPLRPVFYHNEMDILSMVTLTILLHDVHEKPLAHLNRPAELLSLANHYDHIEQWEQNVRIYQQVFSSAALPQHKQDSGIRLGYCLKRLERWEEALKLWEGLSALGPFRLEPYEERAKYFEHRARDLEQAEKIVLQALAKLDIVEQLRSDCQLVECRDSLMFRLNRLRRKLASPPE